MKLKDYLSQYSKLHQILIKRQIADACEVGLSAINHWLTGIRKPRPENILIIENLLKGQVSRHDERPDIYPRTKKRKHNTSETLRKY